MNMNTRLWLHRDGMVTIDDMPVEYARIRDKRARTDYGT